MTPWAESPWKGAYYKEYYINKVRVYVPNGSFRLVNPREEPLED